MSSDVAWWLAVACGAAFGAVIGVVITTVVLLGERAARPHRAQRADR